MVCLSTAEAEFVAATEAANDVLWLCGLLGELGFVHMTPSVIFEDNQACVVMINNHMVSARNRHFAVKMAWLREHVSILHFKFVYVPSKKNLADTFTKILLDEQFYIIRDSLTKGMQTRGEC